MLSGERKEVGSCYLDCILSCMHVLAFNTSYLFIFLHCAQMTKPMKILNKDLYSYNIYIFTLVFLHLISCAQTWTFPH